ncbi:MAG: hypothetical protein IT473_05645 [Lysobacter sp.]|nr:hypothetical protein [Lysobacter sp.]
MSDDFQQELRDLLAGLTEREQRVLRERFGIGIDPSLDLRDVGTRFAATRERIEAIEHRALSRIGDDSPPEDDPSAPSAA